MADVVEKKLDMSLDQIADERKHENSSYQSNRDSSPRGSVQSNSNSPRDHYHNGNTANSYTGGSGKTKNSCVACFFLSFMQHGAATRIARGRG